LGKSDFSPSSIGQYYLFLTRKNTSVKTQFPLEKWMGGMVKLILPAYRRQGFLIEPNGPSYCKQAQVEMLDKKRS
jgi:hypothetical protein